MVLGRGDACSALDENPLSTGPSCLEARIPHDITSQFQSLIFLVICHSSEFNLCSQTSLCFLAQLASLLGALPHFLFIKDGTCGNLPD